MDQHPKSSCSICNSYCQCSRCQPTTPPRPIPIHVPIFVPVMAIPEPPPPSPALSSTATAGSPAPESRKTTSYDYFAYRATAAPVTPPPRHRGHHRQHSRQACQKSEAAREEKKQPSPVVATESKTEERTESTWYCTCSKCARDHLPPPYTPTPAKKSARRSSVTETRETRSQEVTTGGVGPCEVYTFLAIICVLWLSYFLLGGVISMAVDLKSMVFGEGLVDLD